MDYSLVSNQPPAGFEEVPFGMIQEGDNFFENGTETIYRALNTCTQTSTGDGYYVVGEDVDFNKKTFAHAKNNMAYVPKYYVSTAKPMVD